MTGVEEEDEVEKTEEVAIKEPPHDTLEWIQYLGEIEGHLPSPIDISITGSLQYQCPPLEWYNFDVYPHKIKLTNTGYTLIFGAKWMAERPYLVGGPLLDKHVFSQIHFHWGALMTEGSEHTVDERSHPGEMHATFFRSEYLTQAEALKHKDGVVYISYIIKHGVNPDERLQWLIDAFPRIKKSQTSTRVGPYPLSHLVPMFFEDYFIYWGSLETVHGRNHVVRWLVPRVTLFATLDQMKQFRSLLDPWNQPIQRNFRDLKEREDRHVLFINPRWNKYNSLLPIPRVKEPSISVLSPAYQKDLSLLPPQNAYMLPQPEEEQLEPAIQED